MNLQILWFGLIGLLFTGFFVLEGFDYGVGILLPLLGKNDTERRMILNSIGPFWDGNEVWLVTAGGAMFAAFPNWYAALFSGFYPLVFFILLALILRGTAFEFRSLHEHRRWRAVWDWVICVGSLLPGLFCGVAIGNIIEGVPIDAKLNYVGGVWNLLNPFALLCGVTFVVLFTLHGAIFLSLRVDNHLTERALRTAQRLWLPTFLLVLLLVASGYMVSNVFHHLILDLRMIPLGHLLLLVLISVPWLLAKRRSGWAFAMTSLTIILSALILGMGIFPHVMISSLNPAWSLNIENASSSPYTLMVISWVGLTCVPFVLLYQGWNYWVFRKRLAPHAIGHY